MSNKNHFALMSAMLLSGAVAFTACSSDDNADNASTASSAPLPPRKPDMFLLLFFIFSKHLSIVSGGRTNGLPP